MGALDSSSLLMEYGNVWVGSEAGDVVDLGAVRNVKFTAVQNRTKVDSDNRGTIVNKVRLSGVIEFDWLEPGDLTKLDVMFAGMVTKTATAGDLVNNYVQTVNSGSWSLNEFIAFTYQDADATAPNIDSVTGGTDSTLTVNVDYIVVQHDDGRWGIIILDSATVTTESQNVVIQFDYTPATNLILTGGTNQTATNRYVKIIGPSEDAAGTTREIVLAEAVVTSDMLIPFVNVEDANDVGVMPVRIESNKATTWTFTDEINPS